jgi:hypothetical protein
VGGFLGNLAHSTGNFVGNFVHAVGHPVDTLNAMGDTIEGAGNEYVPGYTALKTATGATPETLARQNATVDAFKSNLKSRYGSLDNFGHTLYTDPVGTLADLSAVAGGVSGVARGVGTVAEMADAANVAGGAARVAKVANTVADATNPVAVAGKVVGPVVDAAKTGAGNLMRSGVEKLTQGTLDPAEAAAVQYGHEQGVQIPRSVETGSKVAANAENILQNMPGSAGIAKTAKAATQSTLEAAGANTVDQLGAAPGTNAPIPSPVDAGEAIHAALDQNIAQHHAAAGESYDLLRSIESQPEHLQTVQTGTKRVDSGLVDDNGSPIFKTAPVLEDIQLPVDLRPVKAALQPIYDRMMRQMPVAQQQASAGLKALDNIINGRDYESASITDENLGAIKQVARDTTSPIGQGLAKAAVKQLDQAVRSTVARAGPDATAALEQGRASTIAKYGAQDVKDSLPTEPAQVVAKLTAPGDRSINLLRSVAEQAPEQVPALRQSLVQGLLDQTTADAGMARTQGPLAAWNKLGPETKSVLFDNPQQAQGVTNYLTLAKKIGENPNPSGSAQVLSFVKGVGLVVTAPHVGIPMLLGSRALTKMLFNPRNAEALTLGLKTPAASGAAGAALGDQIIKAAGSDVRPIPSQSTPGTSAPAESVPAIRGVVSNGTSTNAGTATNAGPAQEGQAIRATAQPSTGAASGQTSQSAAGPGSSFAEGGADPRLGIRTVIKVPGKPGPGYPAQYKLAELDDVNPSHNGLTFQPNPKYPIINDRNYSNQVNQGEVVKAASAAEFDPLQHTSNNREATSGPPVDDSDGNVLSGNSRTMQQQRVYAGNPTGAVALRADLKDKAALYGYDPAEVDRMAKPTLRRVIDDSVLDSPAAKQDAISDFNKSNTKALTPAERTMSDARRVSPGTLEDVAARLDAKGPDATVAQVLDGKSGLEILDKLGADGVITPQERAAFADPDGLTAAGRDRIQKLMIGRFFSDPAQLDAIPDLIRGKVERLAAPLAQVESKPGWSLTPDVQAALDLVHRAKVARTPNLDDFIRQDGLFGTQKYSPQAVTLAKALQGASSPDVLAAARQYSQDAAYADKGPSLMGNTPTPAESFADSFGAIKSRAEVKAAAKPAAPAIEAAELKPLSKIGKKKKS